MQQLPGLTREFANTFPVHDAHTRANARRSGLAHELFATRAAALAEGEPPATVAVDLADLAATALGAGAFRAKVVDAGVIVVDDRVTMKCRVPPCEMYGMNHLCPPYSPTAREFANYSTRYKHAVLLQVQEHLPETIKDLVRETDDKWYCQLYQGEEWAGAFSETMMPMWHRLHYSAIAVEREAQARGYAGAVAVLASNCGVCDPAGLPERLATFGLRPGPQHEDANRKDGVPVRAEGSAAPEYAWCDVAKPCPYPEIARPAMEAVGIDVVRTLRNADWELRFPAASYLDEGVAYWTGLVLVA